MDFPSTPDREITQDPIRDVLGASSMEETLLQGIVNQLPGIFYILGPDGRLMHWNDRFEARTGYTPADLRGRRAYEFFEGDD